MDVMTSKECLFLCFIIPYFFSYVLLPIHIGFRVVDIQYMFPQFIVVFTIWELVFSYNISGIEW